MLKYEVLEWQKVTYDMTEEHFKSYVQELRLFFSSYRQGERKPEFIQLMRQSSRGFITECATIPLTLVPDAENIDLDEWFASNYKTVFKYLKEHQPNLY